MAILGAVSAITTGAVVFSSGPLAQGVNEPAKTCAEIYFGYQQYSSGGSVKFERFSTTLAIASIESSSSYASPDNENDLTYAARIGTSNGEGSLTFNLNDGLYIARADVYAYKYDGTVDATLLVTTSADGSSLAQSVIDTEMTADDLSVIDPFEVSCNRLSFSFDATYPSTSITVASSQRTNFCKMVLTIYESSPTPEPEAASLSIHFFDLGVYETGDCIYIKAGDYDILVDGGAKYDCKTYVYPRLDEFLGEDKTIDLAIVTHSDFDHIAMFSSTSDSLFSSYNISMLVDFVGSNSTSQAYSNYLKNRANFGGVHYTAIECWDSDTTAELSSKTAARRYSLGKNLELEFLYNRYYEESASDNNNYSVCFQIVQGNNKYVFMGDAETEAEASVIESNAESLGKSVLYKANHHGSGTSSSPALMGILQPEYIVSPCVVGTYQYATNPENTFPYQAAIDSWAPYTYKIMAPRVVSYDASDVWGSTSLNGEIVVSSSGIDSEDVRMSGSVSDTYLPLSDWFNETRRLKDGTLTEGTPNRTWPETGVPLPNSL